MLHASMPEPVGWLAMAAVAYYALMGTSVGIQWIVAKAKRKDR